VVALDATGVQLSKNWLDKLSKREYNNNIASKERTVRYTLITKTGRVMVFTVKAVAELYQTLNGGMIVTNDILVDKVAQNLYN
jgi:hypothetical protein